MQVTGRPEISDAILRRRPSRDVFAGDKAVAPGALESPVLAHAPTSPPQTSGLGAPPTPLPSVDPKSFSGDSSDVRLLERLKARAGALARKRHGHDIREGVNSSPSLRGGEGGRGGGGEGDGGKKQRTGAEDGDGGAGKKTTHGGRGRWEMGENMPLLGVRGETPLTDSLPILKIVYDSLPILKIVNDGPPH